MISAPQQREYAAYFGVCMKNRDFAGEDRGSNHATKFGAVTVDGRINGVEKLDAENSATG
jgi:hypothetical protein